MREIKEILNPVHLPTVDEWMKIADFSIDFCKRFPNEVDVIENIDMRPAIAFHLMKRFEEITRGKWVEISWNDDYDIDQVINHGADVKVKRVWQPALLLKEHFMCEVEIPVSEPHFNIDVINEHDEYTEAQAKVIFVGLSNSMLKNCLTDGKMSVRFGEDVLLNVNDNIVNPTILDFIYEIDRYNRTAKEPIKINWTDSFINQLLK